MKVSEAIKNRHSVRAFLNNPVSTELIKELLEQSSDVHRVETSNHGKFMLLMKIQ